MKVEPDFGKQARRIRRVPRARLPQRIIRSWIAGGVDLRNRLSLMIRFVAAKTWLFLCAAVTFSRVTEKRFVVRAVMVW